MVKAFVVFVIMVIGFAGAARAAQDTVDLANIEDDLRMEIADRAAKPIVSETYDYYEISGDNERELRRQMTRNGTRWDDGKTYDSVTTWNIDWDYDCTCRARGCTADSFNSRVNITIRYPKWVNADTAPEALRGKWDTYINNLVLHEHGHRDMAVEAAVKLARAVSAMPPALSRAELDRQIKALSKKLMAKMADDQREYDAATVHGTTQGAVFP